MDNYVVWYNHGARSFAHSHSYLEKKMHIRPAALSDLDAVMAVEKATFGEGIAPEAMATRAQMRSRIELFAREKFPEGFLLAEHEGVIVGYMIMFPTALTPEECASWDMATDCGNLAGTFDMTAQNMFMVSFAVVYSAPDNTSALLALTSQVIRLDRLRKYGYTQDCCMFCSRMPGFAKAHKKTRISAEKYWRLEDPQGAPRDAALYQYHRMTAEKPFKIMLDGYQPDVLSGGHGVLFALRNPVLNICTLATLIANK